MSVQKKAEPWWSVFTYLLTLYCYSYQAEDFLPWDHDVLLHVDDNNSQQTPFAEIIF